MFNARIVAAASLEHAGHARADGDALVDVQRHVRLMAARFGHGEQYQHGVVAAHIAAGRGQVAQIRALEIQREAASRRFARGGDGVVYADRAIDGVEFMTAAPFGMRRAHMQGQIRFRRAVHAHGVDGGRSDGRANQWCS